MGRPAAARGRHAATGAGRGGAALLSSWRGLGRPGSAATLRRRWPSGRSNAALPQARRCWGQARAAASCSLPPSLLPSCVLLSGYAAPARRPPPGSGQGGDCWIINKAWLPCWKAALLWDSKWEVNVDGVGAVA